MPDKLTHKTPEDPNKINIDQEEEIQYWAKELQVSEPLLKKAVKSAGPFVIDVKRLLGFK